MLVDTPGLSNSPARIFLHRWYFGLRTICMPYLRARVSGRRLRGEMPASLTSIGIRVHSRRPVMYRAREWYAGLSCIVMCSAPVHSASDPHSMAGTMAVVAR